MTLTADNRSPPSASVTAKELRPCSDMSLMAERTVSDERQDITSRDPMPRAGNDFAKVELITGLVDACAMHQFLRMMAGNEVLSGHTCVMNQARRPVSDTISA